jgi:hypothetical protein
MCSRCDLTTTEAERQVSSASPGLDVTDDKTWNNLGLFQSEDRTLSCPHHGHAVIDASCNGAPRMELGSSSGAGIWCQR